MSAVLNIVEKTKVCTKCDSIKSLSQYGKHKLSRDGMRPVCNSCRHEEYKANRAAAGKLADERKTVRLIDGGRFCLSCGEAKQWNEFAKDIVGYNKKTASCKQCRNEKYKDPRSGKIQSRPDKLMRLYGVTYEHVVNVLSGQHGLCANHGCAESISLTAPMGKGRAVIDHCHITGKFRALLCVRCNLSLGDIEKNKKKFLGLLDYSAKFSN